MTKSFSFSLWRANNSSEQLSSKQNCTDDFVQFSQFSISRASAFSCPQNFITVSLLLSLTSRIFSSTKSVNIFLSSEDIVKSKNAEKLVELRTMRLATNWRGSYDLRRCQACDSSHRVWDFEPTALIRNCCIFWAFNLPLFKHPPWVLP